MDVLPNRVFGISLLSHQLPILNGRFEQVKGAKVLLVTFSQTSRTGLMNGFHLIDAPWIWIERRDLP